jgi:hypothetical protein
MPAHRTVWLHFYTSGLYLMHFLHAAIILLVACLSTTLAAQTSTQPDNPTPAPACVTLPDNETSCMRFVGCLNKGEETFTGRAQGWNEGTITATTNAGNTCTGTWSYSNFLEKGTGEMTCSNAETTQISFFSRQKHAITGLGISNQKRRLLMWAGADLAKFATSLNPTISPPAVQCGTVWLPVDR